MKVEETEDEIKFEFHTLEGIGLLIERLHLLQEQVTFSDDPGPWGVTIEKDDLPVWPEYKKEEWRQRKRQEVEDEN